MAVTVTRVYYPPAEATYDRLSGTYTAKRAYHVDAMDPSESTTDAAIGAVTNLPAYANSYEIKHVEDATQIVTMYAVARTARRIKGGENVATDSRTEVVIEYEGHYIGFVHAYLEGGTQSKKLLYDQGADAIGPNGEGTTIMAPTETLTFVTNEDTDYLTNAIDDDRSVIGKVNEQGWNPTATNRCPGGWQEGTWFYASYTPQANRDGTYTVTRRFIATGVRKPDGGEVEVIKNFYWRNYHYEEASIDGGRKTRKPVYDASDTVSQIYQVAGAGGSATFADIAGIPVTSCA